VHTSRDIRAIARQLVSVWIEVLRKEKASNGGLKLLRRTPSIELSKDLLSGKPALRVPNESSDNNKAASQRQHFRALVDQRRRLERNGMLGQVFRNTAAGAANGHEEVASYQWLVAS